MPLEILQYHLPSCDLLLSRVDILRIEDFRDDHSFWSLLQCDIDDTPRIEEVFLHLAECVAHRLHRSYLSILSCEVKTKTPITGFHTSREYFSDFRLFTPSPWTVPSSSVGESPVHDVFRIPESVPDGFDRSRDSSRDGETSHKEKRLRIIFE